MILLQRRAGATWETAKGTSEAIGRIITRQRPNAKNSEGVPSFSPAVATRSGATLGKSPGTSRPQLPPRGTRERHLGRERV
jgi:hypothetical protein